MAELSTNSGLRDSSPSSLQSFDLEVLFMAPVIAKVALHCTLSSLLLYFHY